MPLNIHDHRRRRVHPGSLPHVFGAIDDVGDIRQKYRRAIAIGNNHRLEVLARQKLIVRLNLIILARPVKIAFRQIETGLLNGSAHVLEVDSVVRERGGIHLNPHGRLLSAADAYKANAGKLRNLLHQTRVR